MELRLSLCIESTANYIDNIEILLCDCMRHLKQKQLSNNVTDTFHETRGHHITIRVCCRFLAELLWSLIFVSYRWLPLEFTLSKEIIIKIDENLDLLLLVAIICFLVKTFLIKTSFSVPCDDQEDSKDNNQGPILFKYSYQCFLFVTLLGEQGLTDEALKACMADTELLQWLVERTAEGQEVGVSGTPSIFINGEVYPLQNLADLETHIRTLAAAQ